jgi:flagellar basal-body rod protein FlgB
MIDAIHGLGVSMAKLALDAAALRHQAIAHNIANLHSENYVPLGVRFDARLAAARRSQAAAGPQLVLEPAPSIGPRPQEMDSEMVKLAQNTIHYQALVRALGRQLAILGVAITEGRRS